MNQCIDKATAIRALDDEITEIEIAVQKANFIIQDVTEDFFDRYVDDPEKNESNILWEFSRASTKANIAQDYLFKIQQELEKLCVRDAGGQRHEKIKSGSVH